MSEWGLFDGTPWEEDTSENQQHEERLPKDFIPMELQRRYFVQLENELHSLEDLCARSKHSDCDVDALRLELELQLDGNIGMFLFHLGYGVERLEEMLSSEPVVETAITLVHKVIKQLVEDLQPHLKA